MRRRPLIVICAVLLCAFALVAPATAKAATGHTHPGVHAIKLVQAHATEHHYTALRLDVPNALGTARADSSVAALVSVTAGSSKIVSGTTVQSPRTRGPPAEGRT